MWCHHRSLSGPNFGSLSTQILFKTKRSESDKQTKPGMKVLGYRWDPTHGVFRHRAYRSACILGHVMAIRVAYCMPHAPPGPARTAPCSRLRRTCHAPLLVIGPRYASCVSRPRRGPPTHRPIRGHPPCLWDGLASSCEVIPQGHSQAPQTPPAA